MGDGVFITAADTGVGKTMCACALAQALVEKGMDIGVYKPVLSGVKKVEECGEPDDAVMLKRASASRDDIELINPYRFSAPVAPAHAACIENAAIDKKLLTRNYDIIRSRHDLTIVEGAGGLMVPVTDDYLVIDLIKDLGCGAVVITDTALGRINHTLMTLKMLDRYGIDIAGVIVNRFPEARSEAAISLLKYLKLFGGTETLGVVPEIKGAAGFYGSFVAAFKKNVDLSGLFYQNKREGERGK